jgi:ATP-binding cassette subfamily B protein
LGRDALNALLSHGQGRHGLGPAAAPLVALVVVTAVSIVASVAQAQLLRLLGELVQRRVWAGMLDVAESVDLTEFERPDFFERLQRVRMNALQRPLTMTQGLVTAVGGLVGSAALVAAVISISPVLLPLLVLALVPLFIVQRIRSRREFAFIVEQTTATRERWYLQSTIIDRDAAKELRAFSLAPVLRDRYDRSYDSYLADLRGLLRRQGSLGLIGTAISGVFAALTLVVLILFLRNGRLDLANVTAALVSVQLLFGRLQSLSAGLGASYESTLFIDDLDQFLASAPAAHAARPSRPAPHGFPGLVVEHIDFTYPGSEAPVLSDVSLEIRPGEVVALVGENGSGKTTLAKLLAALYQPTAGTIWWGDVDAKLYDPESLRRNIAVIFQDYFKYQLPARTNIGVGRPEAIDDLEGIMAAARHSEADRFLAALPHGYETYLSKQFLDGRDLSVGQWQRVALARAFYRDAPFIVLDEPSSALDPRAEQAIFERIRVLLADRTVLLISHRFATVRSADRIVVLSGGHIVDVGSHDDLMARGGLYADLFNLQAAGYLSDQRGPSGAS